MGTRQLTKGDRLLTIKVVCANDKAIKAYMAGLDYIKLEPAK
jgi:hypothetical protein